MAASTTADGAAASTPSPTMPAPARSTATRVCVRCHTHKPVLVRPRNGARMCKACFLEAFEDDVHETIVKHNLLPPGERVAIGASGGKDSTVLAHVLATLNARKSYGVSLYLLSVDEGIAGYRDASLDCVRATAANLGLPLHILAYSELYGYSMDDVVSAIGKKNNCTYCGVFRRQALDRGAAAIRATRIATGHNADDVAETVMMNLLRGDIARLGRCTSATTAARSDMPRVKPLIYAYEKEIVMYAYHRKLVYFSTECTYSPNAYRGFAREFIKDLERVRPRVILDIIRSGSTLKADEHVAGPLVDDDDDDDGAMRGCGGGAAAVGPHPVKHAARAEAGSVAPSIAASVFSQKLSTAHRSLSACTQCGYMTSATTGLCQACNLVNGLRAGRGRAALGYKLASTAAAPATDATRPAATSATPGCASGAACSCGDTKDGCS